MPPRRVPLAVLAAVLASVTACSNGGTVAADRPHLGTASATPVAGVQQVTITTGNDLRFHPSTIVIHPGKVRIVLDNTAAQGTGPPHNVRILGLPGQVPFASAGNTTEYVFDAPSPGKYQFVCTLHVQQGQTGTLVVEKG